MNLHKDIIESKEEFCNLAIEYYNNIDKEYLQECLVIPKSISILLDHDFIPTPCIEIKLEFLKDQKKKAIILYVNEKKEFIDEFLIT